eukprot:gene1190-1368_t
MQSGLAFSTYCVPGVASGVPELIIFDINNQTVDKVPFKDAPCGLGVYGAYDNATQIYYTIADKPLGYTESYLMFGLYSMITQDISYVQIPYEMDKSFTEVLAIDIPTKTSKSILKAESAPKDQPSGQFTFNPNGYIVALVDVETPYTNFVYTINLKTQQYTLTYMPYPSGEILSEYGSNEFCPQ